MKPNPLVLTQGEPASIAPEITAKAWSALREQEDYSFFLLGDGGDFAARIASVGLSIPLRQISRPADADEVFAEGLPVLHRTMPQPSRAAWIDTRNSSFVINMIAEAAELCLAGLAGGMVTNPIHKDALYSVGFKHEGHTDFLATISRAGGHQVSEVMMLVAPGLRAVPLTVHLPLHKVPEMVTAEAIIVQAQVIVTALRHQFGIANPRLWVTGLNPHAGENGAMGNEEQNVIAPAVEALRRGRVDVVGPVPADTAFSPEARAQYDAILCMYHDQALIPVKTLDFHGGVNVTLGLPFIRTSPDHGTALNLAGKGQARADSLIAALNLAAEMAARS
jgi:4-hydroxythreonine-4-phosphate dehydrogenase